MASKRNDSQDQNSPLSPFPLHMLLAFDDCNSCTLPPENMSEMTWQIQLLLSMLIVTWLANQAHLQT